MAGQPLTASVGVLIPAFNAERWLGQALASVATQSSTPDQVIVVNDGSTDGTAAVVEQWRSHLPTMTTVDLHRNEGLWAARNVGLRHLETDAVALLDADDLWLPDHLASVCAVYGGNDTLVSPNALRWIPGKALGLRGWQDLRPIPPPAKQLHALAIENFVYVGALFDRQRALALGGFRNLPLGCEDWDLWLRLVEDGVEVVAAPLRTAVYRLRPDSMSAGDRILDTEIQILNDLLARTDDPRARQGARTGLRHRRARLSLRKAYESASRGDYLRTRARAIRALSGSRRLLPRAAGVAVAPRRMTALRQRLHETGSWTTTQ